MEVSFSQLNDNWNAEPNAPMPAVETDGVDVLLRFFLNPFQFPRFEEDDIGILRFKNCSKYRLGPTNDEGWYRGQCRFSCLAPKWGGFYVVSGDRVLLDTPSDWKQIGSPSPYGKHYLFYFRDNTFECVAEDWCIDKTPNNALNPTRENSVRPG